MACMHGWMDCWMLTNKSKHTEPPTTTPAACQGFKCSDGLTCLDDASRQCDGRADCPDFSDELNCPQPPAPGTLPAILALENKRAKSFKAHRMVSPAFPFAFTCFCLIWMGLALPAVLIRRRPIPQPLDWSVCTYKLLLYNNNNKKKHVCCWKRMRSGCCVLHVLCVCAWERRQNSNGVGNATPE